MNSRMRHEGVADELMKPKSCFRIGYVMSNEILSNETWENTHYCIEVSFCRDLQNNFKRGALMMNPHGETGNQK